MFYVRKYILIAFIVYFAHSIKWVRSWNLFGTQLNLNSNVLPQKLLLPQNFIWHFVNFCELPKIWLFALARHSRIIASMATRQRRVSWWFQIRPCVFEISHYPLICESWGKEAHDECCSHLFSYVMHAHMWADSIQSFHWTHCMTALIKN